MTNKTYSYKCDKCKEEMTIHTVGYIGYSLNDSKEDKLETLCHTHYTERLNHLGINPNKLHADDPRSSTYGASFGMSY